MPTTRRIPEIDAIPYATAFGAAAVSAVGCAHMGEEHILGAVLLALVALGAFAKVIWVMPGPTYPPVPPDDPEPPWWEESP